jgi:hypothetical protein
MAALMQVSLIIVLCILSDKTTAVEPLAAQEPEIVIALGSANVFDSDRYAGYGLEYRHPPVWRKLRPTMGYSATRENDQYVYIGVRYIFDINDFWQFNPTFAVGLFDSGDGINLGGSVEFRSGLEFSRQISDRMRFGIGFAHLSNSRIYESNPGTETLQLSLAIAL